MQENEKTIQGIKLLTGHLKKLDPQDYEFELTLGHIQALIDKLKEQVGEDRDGQSHTSNTND